MRKKVKKAQSPVQEKENQGENPLCVAFGKIQGGQVYDAENLSHGKKHRQDIGKPQGASQ